MPDKKDEKTAEGGAAKKKPPIIIIAIAIAAVAIIGGLVVGKTVSAKSKSAAEKPKPVPGPIMPLDEFLVNLADPSGDHFLKVTVALELDPKSGATPDTLKDRVAPIRDAVLTALCSRTRDQITPLDGRDQLKADIRKDVNTALGEPDVRTVYFSDLVTQ
jgi:flagellar FliL protein